jgi:hypothetical protein
VASAYEAQLLGSYAAFNDATIWQAKTEPKCHFFTWLATLGKAPTADNLLKKNWLGTSTFLSLYWRGFF